MHKGARLELPAEAAALFAAEARRRFPDHRYTPKALAVADLAPHRAHLVRAAVAAAEKLS
jgi:hypothetical protein